MNKEKFIENLSDIKKICLSLQSADRKIRKQAYIAMQSHLSNKEIELTNEELREIFINTHIYTLSGLRDKTESVREQAIKFMNFLIIEKLPLNDFYLTYVFPVLVERIGSVEIIEESEEIRLQLLQFLNNIICKYSNMSQLKPFLNDSVIILCETVKDKYPAIKELSCHSIINLAKALPRDFHMQAENLIKPLLTCFNHQRYKVRLESIYAIGEIIMHSSYKGLDEVVGPLAEKLFDQIPIVRRAVAQITARWLLEYRDRYSFFYKIIPLLLTGLNDEVADTRNEAAQLWEKVGLQFQQENEKDLKDELDYLIQPPRFYPKNIIRPNLGCRTLVKRNISKIAPAISNELTSWQEDVRVRCSQLLCSIALHAEDGITQNLQAFLLAMYSAARDDDNRVVANIIRASELMGCFVKYSTWSDLILPIIEDGPHYGHLSVLSGLINGTPIESLKDNTEEISKILAQDTICNSRKSKYQLEIIECVRVLSEKHNEDVCNNETGYNLFKIIITVISLRHPDNKEKIRDSILDNLRISLKLESSNDLWSLYAGRLLKHINKNPKLWTNTTDEACLFLTILSKINEAFGENLDVIQDILINLADTEVDAELQLKMFYVLATVFERKERVFATACNVASFLENIIQDVFVPSLIWRAGATAEAIRTMAASCLLSALIPIPEVELFTLNTLQPLLDKLLPLLLSLMEDASYRSRQLAIDSVVLLKENCCMKGVWDAEKLVKIYPEILKRLDDPTEKVRLCALKNLQILFRNCPEEFQKLHYKAHHELIIDTLLTHFDDDDESVQDMVYGVLEILARINKTQLLDKIERYRPLLRNQKGCDFLIENVRSLVITEIN